MRTGPAHGSTPFGERVKQARKAKGMSTTQLAAECGIHYAQVSGWENRNQKPSFYTLIAIAQSLGCSLDWLVGLKEN